ncbi:MAG: lactonase family protein [Oscillospiraceae bacterium]|nr:lactonase family protein [Oscillospiraceae bacterium]
MSKLIAYVGRGNVGPKAGGIDVFEIGEGAKTITPLNNGVDEPIYAGFLAYAKGTKTLYAVDERKDSGRSANPPTTVMAFKVDPQTAGLSLINKQPTIGSSCASVCVGPDEKYLFTANHGKFDCVLKAVENSDGTWSNKFVYDDSTTVQYPLNADGSIEPACDCFVFTGHGMDPNSSPQGGGHSQASPHAHIVVVDPSGKFLLVCEKASEKIYVFRLGGDKLVLASIYQAPLRTGPRHIAFDNNGHAFMTCEFSSEIWAFSFDSENGILHFVDKKSTVAEGFSGRNELATVQVTPNGKLVYVNNRGEDTIVCYQIAADGTLTKSFSLPVGKCPADPKDAVRDMQLTPDGKVLLVPVRPDDVIRAYAVDQETGALTQITEAPVENPVFICLAEL